MIFGMTGTFLELSTLITTFRIVDVKTLCSTTHGPKHRAGVKVSEDEALDDEGGLKPKYEELRDPETDEPTGEYVKRADSSIYEDADKLVKDTLKGINDLLGQLTFVIGGGTLILPTSNYDRWEEVKSAIAGLVAEANDQLEHMVDDAGNLINDGLRARGKDPIQVAFEPLLHPETKLEGDGVKMGEALFKSVAERLDTLQRAISEVDPDGIVAALSGTDIIPQLFADEAKQAKINALLALARKARGLATEERRKVKLAEQARSRAANPDRDAAARDRDLKAAARHESEAAEHARDLVRVKQELVLQGSLSDP